MPAKFPPGHRPLAATLILGGGALTVFSQNTLLNVPVAQRSAVLGLIGAGVFCFLLGSRFVLRRSEPAPLLRRLAAWLRISPWQVVALVLGLLFAVLTALAAGDGSRMLSPVAALLSWGASVGLVLLGAKAQDAEKRTLRFSIILVGILWTVVAFLPRGIATGEIPPFLSGDEGSAGLSAVGFVTGDWNNIFVTGWFSFPSLYFFIQSLFVRVFGQTTEALRLLSALAGALTVTAVYFTGSAMFNRRAGFLAALFLAAFHFHVHFSRIGLNNIWDGLWYTVSIGALWYAWERENRTAYLVSGLALGLAQYFYPSSRILFGLLPLAVLLAGVFDRPRLKRALPDLTLMLLAALTVFLPLGIYYLRHPDQYLAPIRRVSIFGPWIANEMSNTGLSFGEVLARQLFAGLQAFTYAPLRFWYTPDTPLLRSYSAGIFLLGVFLLLTRLRQMRSLLLLLWLAAFVGVSGLSESTPAAQRLIAVAPACALVIGFVVSEIASLLQRLWPRGERLFVAAAFLLVAALAADDMYFYFNGYTPHTRSVQVHSNAAVAQHLADYLQDKPGSLQVVFFGQPSMGFYSIPSLQYLAPHIRGVDMVDDWGAPENPEVGSGDLLFVFLPGNEDQINAVRASYPGGTLLRHIATDGEPLYWLYEVNSGG